MHGLPTRGGGELGGEGAGGGRGPDLGARERDDVSSGSQLGPSCARV